MCTNCRTSCYICGGLGIATGILGYCYIPFNYPNQPIPRNIDEYNAQQTILREYQLRSWGFIICLTGASVFMISFVSIIIRCYKLSIHVVPEPPPIIKSKRTRSENIIVEKPKIDIPTETQQTHTKASSSLSPFLKPFTVPKLNARESKDTN